MKTPICNILSLVIPTFTAVYGFNMVRSAKGATNMGEALGPFFAVAILLTFAAVAGEVSAWVALLRGERLVWLSWLGLLTNGVLLLPAAYLVVTGDWK